jgi:GNAT superfamily N-acetyltransferase
MTDPDSFVVRLADPAAPESRALVAAMEEEIEDLYADRPGSIHSVGAQPEAMTGPDGCFLVVFAGQRAVGCGGFKGLDAGICEVKRMYLLPEVRGLGLSARLLAALEQRAASAGYARVRLDTGDRQPAAMHLYLKSGYREIGDYNGNTAATHWFEKELVPASPHA